MDKIAHAKELIRKADALMCSFGKDSMVLLHLTREVFPDMIPVIYHRHPWFSFKNQFADSVINSWGLEVHDYPPMMCGVKAKKDRIELVARYRFGRSGALDLPMNTEPPVARRHFVCGLKWVMRPKSDINYFPWQTVLIGHKSSDVDPYDGAVPLKSDEATIGGTKLLFPLRHWTDDDVWDYIEANHVPYDKRRYENRTELSDKWLNPDYLNACTSCVDPRNTAPEITEVFCPLTGGMVPNRGNEVMILEQVPDYIERKVA